MRARAKGRTGAALVEFALVALLVYLIAAAGIELGRAIFVAQTIQDAARVAARELALVPQPADADFPTALANSPGVWDPNNLVIDLSACQSDSNSDADIQAYVQALPSVNRALFPVYIHENVNGGTRPLLRYPGALLQVPPSAPQADTCPAAATDLTVQIPVTQTVGGTQTVMGWLNVLEESQNGQFAFSGTGGGLAGVTVNYPFQSAMLSGFQQQPAVAIDPKHDPMAPNLPFSIEANDQGMEHSAPQPNQLPDGRQPTIADPDSTGTTYSGEWGLGGQYALAKGAVAVRPYRNIVIGQALFRREVVSQ